MHSLNDMIFQEMLPDAIPPLEREATVQLWRLGHNQLSYQDLQSKTGAT